MSRKLSTWHSLFCIFLKIYQRRLHKERIFSVERLKGSVSDSQIFFLLKKIFESPTPIRISSYDLGDSVTPQAYFIRNFKLESETRASFFIYTGKLGVKMVMRSVDLRSDTVTRPTDAMREAMCNAEVDDDVLGYDPTARRLEEEMAKMMGKEAALFVPSGTMGNLISVMVHCDVRGSEVILGDNCHIHVYENGGISTIGGVHPKTVKNEEDGTMDLEAIEAAIRDPKGSTFYPSTRLICLENTHANSGGRCLSVEYTEKVGEIAKRHGVKLHIDGARLFNASIALGVPVHKLVKAADSVQVCLSKGLGAPVGSVIVGSQSFIEKAKTVRKTLGGGMRQIGVLCAAALVALQENLPKLQHDHKKAKLLAEGLNQMKGIRVNVAAVETNMIFMDMEDGSRLTAEKLRKNLEENGILLIRGNSSRIRIVIHHQITTSDVHYTLSCFQQAMLTMQEPSRT